MVTPDLPFDEFRFCFFQRWQTGEIAYIMLSLVYGTLYFAFRTHNVTTDPIRFVEDGSAFLIVVYSARYGYRHLVRAKSTLSLLDRLLEDTTIYFFAIVTWHLLVIFFELFASVSD